MKDIMLKEIRTRSDGGETVSDVFEGPAAAPTVIIDTGSCTTKFGFGGDAAPGELASVVGRPKHVPMCLLGSTLRDTYIGDEMKGEKYLKYSYPISGNQVTDWDDVEKLWRHVFRSKLEIDHEEHPLLVTVPDIGRTERDNYQLAIILFECFLAPRAFVASPAALSLLSFGRSSTGLVIDSGHGQTTCVPVYNGFPLGHAAQSLPVGGREIASHLGTLLGPEWKQDEATLLDIKEKFCRVEVDPYHGVREDGLQAGEYTLPDGRVMEVGPQAFLAPEVLFTPFLGLGATVPRVIANADCHLREQLWGNIVLTGGNTLLPGFSTRLDRDLKAYPTPNGVKKVIKGFRDPKSAAWRGGSMLSSLSTFRDMCIPNKEYDEYGPVLLRRKCLGITF
ncbi:actin, cytoplasmic 1 [Podospora aff. communis PSN243]|uniref:Actin, cytoplasmic 1 n=1 Tax=Podospora aff. communis PSN243 TaxID=3040156 RepID=A0AAV9G3G1_9PEZI|nr:actin, cytoplasmic 1 [Podospora aff. communis PSN243]